MIKFPLQQLIKFIDIVLEMLEDLVVQLVKLDPARLPVLLSQSVSQSGLELQGQLKIGRGDLVNECNIFCVGHARCLSWWV